jgi:two-component system sensor histidine kinase FlrB
MHGVLTNLLDNAIQHTDAGGLVRVTVSESDSAGNGDETGRLRVEVNDTGSGIAPENIARVFEPFFTTRARGTGLGLAITRKTIHDHGGAITVKSEPGNGTSFTITLPLPQ